MALISLGEAKWRMLRRGLIAGRFRPDDVLGGAPGEVARFLWLADNGFLADTGGGWFELTPKGAEAADLGLYETDPRATPPGQPAGAAPDG